jgi:hypothetical protein
MNRTLPRLAAAGLAVGAALALAACTSGTSGHGAAGGVPSPVATATKTTRTAATTKDAAPRPAPTAKPGRPAAPQALPVDPGAGSRPQTQKYPSTRDTAFRNAMYDVWLAVTTGKASYGRDAFFPEAAYAKVKAIAYPQSDWTSRLWLDFALDVGAAHSLVGSHAKLLRVDMAPADEAAWVAPGYCYNSVGYWHINGARLVYLKNGQERSIGIASLISWRGVWYVVHFGGVIRPEAGLVDDPEAGPGVPGPAGGC